MKSQKLHLLLGVLLFAPLCGAPHRPRSTSPLIRVKNQHAEACAVPVDAIMSNVRKTMPRPGGSKLRKKRDDKPAAATKIQAVARGRQVRNGRVRGASDASSASRTSTPRSASPKKRVASAAEAAAMPVTAGDGFIG